MKSKYIFGFLAVAGAMSLTSCDDFLNENRYPLSKQTVNQQFWSNEVNVQNQINYFYEDYTGYGNGSGSGTFYWSWLSDDQVGRTALNDWKYKSVPATNSSYTAPYTEIRRANIVIEGVEGSTLSESLKAHYIGLARMHRARSYYDLVRRFGDVPLILEVLESDSEALYGPRTPRAEVMDAVLKDLDYAAENISAQSNKTGFSKDAALAFKVDVMLFEAAYQKYHLNNNELANKYYGEAVKAGEAVAARYSINPDYLSLYQSANKTLGDQGPLQSNAEIIMCKLYNEGVFMNSITDYSNASDGVAGLTKSAFEAFTFRDGLPASKTSYDTSDLGEVEADGSVSIAKLLEVRDARLGYITYDYLMFPGKSWSASNTGAMSSVSGYGVRKFNNPAVPATVVNEINKNYLCAPLFWAARVYVGVLEAKAEMGTLTDADLTKYMKPLWDRAKIDTSKLSVAFLSGINDTANNMNVSSLIWEIRRLRRCELMLDDDIRYWDLIRWKQLQLLDPTVNPDCLLGANVSNIADVVASTTGNYLNGSFGQARAFKEAYYLYPLATEQLQLNPELKQNPGWE